MIFSILENNKIKFLDGNAFRQLSNLKHIFLTLNDCVNENFEGLARIAVLHQTVTEKCCQYYNKCQTDAPVMVGTSIISQLQAEVDALKLQLSQQQKEKKQCSQQLDFNKELQGKLETQWIDQTEMLSNDLQFRLQEIVKLKEKIDTLSKY